MGEAFDVIIIGAGPGGYVSAIKAAELGLRVAVVESREVGGTCLNRGCIPTKALLHASQVFREMRESERLGIRAENVTYDIESMYARKDEVVRQLREGIIYLFNTYKGRIRLIQGHAVINAPENASEAAHTVTVDCYGEPLVLTARYILIATGSVPVCPPIPGLTLPGVLTSDDLLDQSGTAYRKLTIIGGGVIGVEFATVFNGLGCAVNVIEAMDRLLPGMDRELSQNLGMILKRRGVGVYTQALVSQITPSDKGLLCHFTQKGETHTVEADAVLVAVGRKPNLAGLLAEGISLPCDRGIVVDAHFQTSVPGIYAIGDVTQGSIQLAHAASAQGWNAVRHMAGLAPAADLSVIPACVYTDPEIACVGLTAAQAKAKGIAVKTGKFNMTALGKSLIESRERSFVRLVFAAEGGALLGAQLMCARATDLIGELATAIAHKLTADQLASVVRPHPSFSEGITEAAADV